MKFTIPVNPTYHEVNNDVAKQWEKNKSPRYKEYRKKWSNNPLEFKLEEAPLHLDIEPTSACNLKCPMCPRTVMLESGETNLSVETMPLDVYKKIIDEAAEIGVYSIKLNWLGEPMVHPDIVEMVRYAKEKGLVDVMFNTNGTLLNENISVELIEAGIDKIFFSFDSPNKEKYESIRIGAKFDEVYNNIKRFVELRNEMGRTTPLTRMSMVLMEENSDEFEEYVEMFKDIVDVVAYVEFREPMRETQKEYNYNFACSQLWQRMFIAADGEVIVCCVDNTREYVVGNIHQNSIKEIWRNEKYMEIRAKHSCGKYNEVAMCSKCDLPNRKESGTV
ncbi:radical SAM/SPASM domain-containing protein [Fusibacter sp. JL216-2]|uniref:radical SAM/SPASM domain-containing protein n=1 Tax=Fusibacter sp. JL216-2 TaxID=3071453 RepID=UPI003D32686F